MNILPCHKTHVHVFESFLQNVKINCRRNEDILKVNRNEYHYGLLDVNPCKCDVKANSIKEQM